MHRHSKSLFQNSINASSREAFQAMIKNNSYYEGACGIYWTKDSMINFKSVTHGTKKYTIHY